MLKAIDIYLITDGDGIEAVEFYKDALGAELLSLMQWKDGVPDCPPEYAELVMNAQLSVDGIRVMISDENPELPYQWGTNMTACLVTDSIETSESLYAKLSQGARDIQMPLQETFWSPAYANLIDRFGMFWQITTQLDQ